MPGQSVFENGVRAMRSLLRLFAVGMLALILQIPISMIGGLIGERQQRRDSAVAEVTGKWGEAQSLVGPALLLPYTYTWRDDDAKETRSETRHLVVLPKRLDVQGKLVTETRKRGIFSIPVYSGDLQLSGAFEYPDLSGLAGITPGSIGWQNARLVLGISDPKAIQNAASVVWRGTPVAFLPGTDGSFAIRTGIHAPVDASGSAGPIEFSIPLSLQGSVGMYVAPFGETTRVTLAANSANPSFQGGCRSSGASRPKASRRAGRCRSSAATSRRCGWRA